MEGRSPFNVTSANESSACLFQADFQYSFFAAVYSTVFVLGLLENMGALYLLTCRAAATPRSFVYLINLAVVDTLFVCVLPFKIHYHLNGNNWIFGDVACSITGSVYFVNIYLSIAFFTCICVDRYIAVLHPFAYIRIKSGHYGMVAIVLWGVAASIMIPLILGGPLAFHESNRIACFESFEAGSWRGRMVPYNVCALVFGFAIPFVIILISYPMIARSISRIPRSARKRKALGTIYLILLICMTCFLPYHLTHLFHFLMRAGLIQNCRFAAFIYKMRRVTMALISFNCCLNPILYYFTSAGKQWHWRLPFKARTTKVYAITGRVNCKNLCGREEQQRDEMEGVTLSRAPKQQGGLHKEAAGPLLSQLGIEGRQEHHTPLRRGLWPSNRGRALSRERPKHLPPRYEEKPFSYKMG